MKKIQYILYLFLMVSFSMTSCVKEDLFADGDLVQEGLPSSVSISFQAQENTIVTRAERDPKYENRVDNIYMFIFDSQGNVHYRKFFEAKDIIYPTESHDNGKLQLNTRSLNHARIVGIANVSVEGVTATAYTITEADLNNINSYSELENMVMTMDQSSVERYAIFMMTGMAEDPNGNTDVTIPGTEGGTQTLDCSIKLRRTDAKVKFVVTTDNVNGYEEFSFSPRSWVVKRVPKQSYILPKTSGDYNGPDAQYFTSLEMPFEVITRDDANPNLYKGGSFVYYMPENRKTPRVQITGSASDNRDALYALREKWEGTHDNGDKVFLNANDSSTYVEITGLLSYNVDGKNTNADIRLIVHLGNPEEKNDGSYDVNNYNTNRNTYYTYNVKICGVNDIKVEVESTTELRPGYEGDVVDTENKAFVFDSHYDRCKIKIKPSSIPQENDGEIYWSVNTPFSRGVHTISDAEVEPDLRDYRWVKFAVNAEYGVPEDQYVKYPGDQNYDDPYPFSEQANNKPSPYYEPSGDGYSAGHSDVLGRDYNSSTARLMDINQLMKYLRELGKIKKDWGEGIAITVFIDEYLYFKHPIDESYPVTGKSLWKLTSDKEDRILYLVINKPQYSKDGNSSVVKAEYSFRQRTIRTIYNVDHPDLQTAWGLESVMETSRLAPGDVSLGKDTRNGRQNCLNWLVNSNRSLKWTDVLNVSGDGASDDQRYQLKGEYNSAAYACLIRNRDLNGNNIVDAEEVRWYLASIDQLTDIYLGEYALDEPSRLYPSNPADRNYQTRWHYTSSTGISPTVSWILWAEEGASRGGSNGSKNDQNGKNELFSYRCVRNLGISLENPNEVPADLISVEDEGDGYYLIDVTRMNAKARRSSAEISTLPAHDERSDVNRPYAKFRVHSDAVGGDGQKPHIDNWNRREWNDYGWQYFQTFNLGKPAYRIPNQRELLIMTTRMPQNAWPEFSDEREVIGIPQRVTIKPDYICQTKFSLNGKSPYSQNRYGFMWHSSNREFFLVNDPDIWSGKAEEGYVRPVQDVQ